VKNIDTSDELIILEKKREALEETVRIALNIERLHKGLEAALAMGQETHTMPREMLDTMDELTDTTIAMTSPRLREILATLEQVVKSKLDQILKISEMDERQLAIAETGRIEKLVDEYRRQARTAVAVRVLLHSRGEATKATELGVAPERIQARLTVLEQKEQQYRGAIRNELKLMITETERMLAAEGLDYRKKMFLEMTLQDFSDNIEHLDSGRSITSMPFAIEMVEMSETEITSLDTAPDLSATSVKEEAPPTVQTQKVFAPLEQPTAPPPVEIQKKSIRAKKGKPKRHGLFGRFIEWVTTPDEVKWKDTKR